MKTTHTALAQIHRNIGECPCGHCGAVDGFTRREQGPHLGESCRSCDGWQRWVPRREGLRLVEPAPATHVRGPAPEKESPPKYSPKQLADPASLYERVASLEHDVSILAQVVTGGRHVD